MAKGRHPLTGKFMPGFSGNPNGPAKGRKISHQIELLLEQEDPETGKKKVELLAEKMLEHALSGKAPAWAEMILNRVEGKVPDVVITKDLDDMSTEELAKALRGVADAVDPPDPNANGCLGDRPGAA